MIVAICLVSLLANDAISLPWPLTSTEDGADHHLHKRETAEESTQSTEESTEEQSLEEADRDQQSFPVPHYPDEHKPGNYGPKTDNYGSKTDNYGPKTDKKCETYYDYEYVEKCINYNDKVCYTKYLEHCRDVTKDNCKGLITSEQVRKCTNVTELLCGLAETVKYEMATASYTVQKCHKIKERVCDTVYEPEIKSKDDYHCINLKTYKCHHKEKTMYDKTCRHITKHYCDTHGSDYSSHGSDYSSHGSDYSSGGSDAYGASSGGYGEVDTYGPVEPKCTTKEEVKCYETPRTVPTLECTDEYEKVCEKFAENVPYAAEKQACHDEEKRICELEERQQPKQVKKYVYKKSCKKIPREICSSADMKQLVPSCAPTTYKNCQYEPNVECEEVPKKHCYKVPKKIKKQRCYNEYETQYGDSSSYSESKPYDKYQESTYDSY